MKIEEGKNTYLWDQFKHTDPKYTKQYPVGPGSIFYDPSIPQAQQTKLSKKQRHGAQVNVFNVIQLQQRSQHLH